MGGGNNEITISAVLDTIGFKKGTKQLEKAISGITGSIKRMAGSIIGAVGVYQMLSKAVNAYMAENQKLSAQLNSMWTALGNVLGPIINQIVAWVTSAMSYFLEFLRLLGLTSKTASQLSKKASKAGSDLKKTVAGFDELNLLQDGGGGGGPNGQLEDKEAPQWIKDIADFLKQGEWEKAGTVLADKLNEIIANVDWKGIGEKIGYYLNGALSFLATVIKTVNWKRIGSSLATALNNLLYQVDFKNLGTVLAAKFTTAILMIGGFLEELDWEALANSINDFAITFFDEISKAIEAVDWYKIGDGIGKLLAKIDWVGIAQSLFRLIGVAIGAAASLLWGIIEDTVKKIKDYFSEYIQKYIGTTDGNDPGGELVAGILDGIVHALADIGTWIYNNLFKPFIDGFKKAFKISSPSKVMEEQGGFIIQGLLNGLKSVWKTVTDWLGGLWNDFYNGFKDIISSAWDWGADIITGLWNGISSKLNDFWAGIRDIAQGIRDFLGFSEPKLGPLSDFHTYGPDMMELYAKGIESNKGKVLAAVGDVAEGVSEAMSEDYKIGNISVADVGNAMDVFSDKIVDGFTALMDRLQAIADNVVFTMPAVAGGGIVPYGITGGSGIGSAGNGNEDLYVAIERLIELIEDFKYSVDNMQWVAQFGNLRAVVEQITKIQKQDGRANG